MNATNATCIEDVEENQNFDVTCETLETRTPQMENSLKKTETSDVIVIVNTDPLKKETSLIDTYCQQIEELSATDGTEAEEKQNYIQTESLQTRTPSMARNSTRICPKSIRKIETVRQKPNDSTSGTWNEKNTELKMKRKLLQKQENFDLGSFPTENGEITHEEQITEKEERPVIIETVDLVAEDDLQDEKTRLSSSFNINLPFSDKAAAFSKVTLRRKLNKDDFGVSISRITPPWESIENDTLLETRTPMAAKNMRYSLLRDVLTKEKSTGARLHKHRTSSVDSGAISTVLKHADVTHLRSSMKKTLSTGSLVEGTTDLRNTSKKDKGFSVKIPDFAAIHKRNFDKMESIDDYKRRKDERAKKLLSGRKPTVDKTPKKQTKKMLRFDPNVCEKPKPANFIPLPTTPIPVRRVVNESIDCLPSPIRIQTPIFKYTVNKENMLPAHKRVLTPRCKENLFDTKSEPIHARAVTPMYRKVRGGVLPFGIPRNQFGFNDPEPPVVIPKREEMKAIIVQKRNIVKNTVDTRREIIKGVRSNRRFKLLMNMRKGKQ